MTSHSCGRRIKGLSLSTCNAQCPQILTCSCTQSCRQLDSKQMLFKWQADGKPHDATMSVTGAFAKKQIERRNQTLSVPFSVSSFCLTSGLCWGWEGESRAWTLSFFRICHVPLICKLQEKAIHGLIPQANTGHGSDICSGVPSDTDFAKHGAGHAEAWGLSSCPQVRAFVPRAQLSHC